LHEFASEAETGKVVRSPVDNNIASVVEEPDMRLRRAFAAMAKADSFFIEIELGFEFDLQSRRNIDECISPVWVFLLDLSPIGIHPEISSQ
jgi:hypothetical protein